MTPRIPENFSTWLVDWSLVTIMGNTMPPRDPNDDDEAEDEDGDADRTTTSSRRSSENPTNSAELGQKFRGLSP
jgi:hypothetical protein